MGSCGYLEWHPYHKDRTMGLNHQLASLSCALSEAFFLNRTLLLPDHICLFGLHTERWPGKQQPGERCIRFDTLVDVELLSRLVPLHLRPMHSFNQSARAASDLHNGMKVIDGSWSSARVAAAYPCDGKQGLIRRRVDGFWFSQCQRRNTDGRAVLSRIHQLLGAPPSAPKPINVLLRSGLFYAPAVKRAAAAIRARIGTEYVSLHVRRSDKLVECSPQDCRKRDLQTRPEALGRALGQWFPPRSHVYIGSTERPAFFEPLRAQYNLHFAEDFAAELVNISNNYALYAVETLVFFGSIGSVETLGFTSSWFVDACFPAAQLRHTVKNSAGRSNARQKYTAPSPGSAVSPGQAAGVSCIDAHGVEVNGVFYGKACIDNPPCGKQMYLVPPPSCSVAARMRLKSRETSRCGGLLLGAGVRTAQWVQGASAPQIPQSRVAG